MRDLVIIGGGAASQAAAMYALGKGIDFLLVCDHFGGRAGPATLSDRVHQTRHLPARGDQADPEDAELQLIGSSAMRLFERQIGSQSRRVLYDRAIAVRRDGPEFVIETQHGALVRSGALIVATGATPRGLPGVPGGELVTLLGFRVTPKAAAFAGKVVAVFGDSEQALYTAAELAHTARQLYLALPNAARAECSTVALLQRRPNVEVLPGYTLAEAHADGQQRLLVLSGGGDPLMLTVEAAFADPGYKPATALVRHMVKTGPDGFIQVDRGFATSVPGLFAAGDVTSPEGENVLAAVGDGARAARSAHFYLLTRPTALALAVGQGR